MWNRLQINSIRSANGKRLGNWNPDPCDHVSGTRVVAFEFVIELRHPIRRGEQEVRAVILASSAAVGYGPEIGVSQRKQHREVAQTRGARHLGVIDRDRFSITPRCVIPCWPRSDGVGCRGHGTVGESALVGNRSY